MSLAMPYYWEKKLAGVLIVMHNLRNEALHTGEARGKGLTRTFLLIKKHSGLQGSNFLTTLLPKCARTTRKRLEKFIFERGNLSPCTKKLPCMSQYTKSLHCKIVLFPFTTDLEISCIHTSVQQEQVSKCGTCRIHCKCLPSKNKPSKSFKMTAYFIWSLSTIYKVLYPCCVE